LAKIKLALISVSDKSGIVEFAKKINEMGVNILSTGGTAKLLRENGLFVKDVSEHTGFPEMLDGRVKTLHPIIHGGLLGIRDNKEHMDKMKQHSIDPIDMVLVNLYPFEATISKPDCKLEDAIENIDIGGPTMLRSAAKNYQDVTVIVDPDDYDRVLNEMVENDGETSISTNFYLSKKVFSHTARYDSIIANYLGTYDESKERTEYPDTLNLNYVKAQSLRYGENPHQSAAFYKEHNPDEPSVSNAVQLQGKELSFNNIIDIDAAFEAVKDLPKKAAVVIKHTNPCGAAISDESHLDAYKKARATDPVSAFGSIVGINGKVDEALASEIITTFVEAVIAPDYDDAALKVFESKKNLRILKSLPLEGYTKKGHDLKKVTGGLLIQMRDTGKVNIDDCKVVTERKPTEGELTALDFAWRVCKHVKSNAIVYSTKDQIIGVGAGQMSRVDSAKIGVIKANFPIKGTVLASDAFFPFRDGIDAAAEAGVTAIIQPGGSQRDEEVITAANEHGIAMVFTGMRHFKH
jgi:phosphoribosylaminoimidazolecarboxamide formyltransferase/IMP cyclohydrolase